MPNPMQNSIQQPALHIIGTVHSDILRIEDAPKFHAESDRIGTLEILPEYQEGLDGVTVGKTIVVLCWFHQANREVLRVYPRGDKSKARRVRHPQSHAAQSYCGFRAESPCCGRLPDRGFWLGYP